MSSSFPGIQTQTYRSLGVVLFKKSAAGEGVAEANGGQGEGEPNTRHKVDTKFTLRRD